MTPADASATQPRPAIEPREIAAPLLLRLRAHDGVAQAGVLAVGMIDVLADRARQHLHSCGARKALRAIGFERRRVIIVLRQHVRQADRVLHRLAGALREILQHRMRGIAEQRDAPVDPALGRIAVAQHPEPPVRAVADDAPAPAHAHGAKPCITSSSRHRLAGDRLRRVVVIGDDEVEHLPARQRVMHDVAFRAGPQRRRVPAQILRHLLGRDHRAVGGVAGDARRPVRGDLLAHIRPQPVGADQERAGDALAVGKPRGDRRPILIVAHDFAGDAQIDQRAVAAGLQEHAMQIAAMHDRIGIAEARAEIVAEIDMGDLFGGQRIHQPELVDIDGHAARGLADAEIVEGVEGVRPELDAGADLAERRRLFQQDRADALLREARARWRGRRCRRRRSGLAARARHQPTCPYVRARPRRAAARARPRC